MPNDDGSEQNPAAAIERTWCNKADGCTHAVGATVTRLGPRQRQPDDDPPRTEFAKRLCKQVYGSVFNPTGPGYECDYPSVG